MKSKEQPYSIEQIQEDKEQEPKIKVPIINVIRHGSTEYKELQDPNFQFNSEAEDFELNSEHLDLNEKGIEEINETADQLADTIDKEKEVIVLVTSPNFRAHSSTLLLEQRLRQRGITILNPEREIKKSRSLRQITQRPESSTAEWMVKDQAYRKESPDHQKEPADEAIPKIARLLGKDISEIFTEDFDEIDNRFQRFLRHMTNLDYWLQDETKDDLADKKIRVVCLTHEEILAKFMKQTLGTEENLKKGQMIEIRPQRTLEAGESNNAKVILYPKGESEQGEASIAIRFSPEKK